MFLKDENIQHKIEKMKGLTVSFWQKFLFRTAKEKSTPGNHTGHLGKEKELKKLTGKIIPYRRHKVELF